jgi:retron-type reverse transcriptase
MFKSADQCIKTVRWKKATQQFEVTRYMHAITLRDAVLNHTFKSTGYKNFTIQERGKTRHIQAVSIKERVVQKCLCAHGLKPILVPTFIATNCASIKGRGLKYAIDSLTQQLVRHYRQYGLQGGIYTFDVHGYFDHIDHDILLRKLEHIIYDKEIYALTKYFIERFDHGLGLGSEVSQLCAGYYLNDMDHIIIEQYHIIGYGRYNDDIISSLKI